MKILLNDEQNDDEYDKNLILNRGICLKFIKIHDDDIMPPQSYYYDDTAYDLKNITLTY